MRKLLFILLLIPFVSFGQIDSVDVYRNVGNVTIDIDSTPRYIPVNVYDTVSAKLWVETESTVSVLDSVNGRIEGAMIIVYTGYCIRQLNVWYKGNGKEEKKDKYVDTEDFLYDDKKMEIPQGKVWMHRYLKVQ